MAKETLTTTVVTIAGVDYSSQISSAGMKPTVEENDTTCFGDTAKRREGGLKDGQFNCTFKPNDDLTNATTINGLLGTVVAVTWKSNNGAIAAANPELQANALVTEGIEFGGAVGGIIESSVSWPLDTVITYDTTP